METTREVWLAGATGLTGRETLTALLGDERVARVLALVRRPTGVQHVRLDEKLVDFDKLDPVVAGRHADVAVCCLGTTIKQAGSRAAFRKVDHDYVLSFAQEALVAGAAHFVVVTALGSDPHSHVFYNRVKGEVERALSSMPFSALTIVRPSLLIGDRASPRLGERLLAPLARRLPLAVRGIDGRTVGRALARLALEGAHGKRVIPSKALHALGA